MLRSFWLLAVATLLAPSLSFAQALVVTNDDVRFPRPWRPVVRPSFTITSLDINANVRERAAEVTVSQSFRNDSPGQQEVQFFFPLPAEAAVDDMTLLVDGKEFPAELLDADKARQQYEAIVRSKKDPALLEFIGGQCFKTRVFPVPAGAERTVTVHYTRFLPADFGVADLDLPLSATKLSAKPVSKVNVAVHIEAENLKSVYSPSHPVKIERPADGHARITWKDENIVPDQDFRLLIDSGEESSELGGRLLTYRPDDSEDGFFLFLATPSASEEKSDEEAQSKTVLFVLDRSGSMTGVKIGQAREAMQFVLDHLNDRDAFNILTYSNSNTLFSPELQRADADTLKKAGAFAAGVAAGGGTNIEGALQEALRQAGDNTQPTYMLFLTDGKPTVGQRNIQKIAEMVRANNDKKVRLISFGVGEEVNSKLLDQLSTENGGFSSYVRPSEDIEDSISKVFRRLTSPVLVDAKLNFEFNKEPKATPTNFVYPGGTVDLFAGQELIVVGRYRATGKATAVLSGRVGDKATEYRVPVKFAKKQTDSRMAFIEKLWATRRIGDLINEIDLNGKNDELIEELVQLSTKHGILTRYTAFLADENTNITDLASNARRSRQLLDGLAADSGAEGFSQRGVKQSYSQSNIASRPLLSNAAQKKAESFDSELKLAEPAAPAGGGAGGGGLGGGASGFSAGEGAATTAPGAFPEYLRLAGRAGKPADEADYEAAYGPKVQDAAGQTVYRRGRKLVTAETADLDPEKDKFVDITRFSTEYFDLVKANTAVENSVLSRQADGDELWIKLRGTNYRIR